MKSRPPFRGQREDFFFFQFNVISGEPLSIINFQRTLLVPRTSENAKPLVARTSARMEEDSQPVVQNLFRFSLFLKHNN